MDPVDQGSDLDPEHCCKASLKQRQQRASLFMYIYSTVYRGREVGGGAGRMLAIAVMMTTRAGHR